MYNRYMRHDEGAYRRIHPERPCVTPKHTGEREPPREAHSAYASPKGPEGMLSGLLSRFKLSDIDAGDLLLLVLIFLLFRDGEDEELLIALGLLLIL